MSEAERLRAGSFVQHGEPGNGPVTYHGDHLAAPCCAEVQRLQSAMRWALQYLTAGGREFIATAEDGQAAVDTLRDALA